nr:hypothetical protein [Gemmatimonadota bacterium]NIU52318.1 hypothetical protein [Gemmatimonadota bacterium]NIW36584.1 hypothetical protein [Gemmatimonadota bacterium]
MVAWKDGALSVLAAAVLLWPPSGLAQQAQSSCVGCHGALSDERLAEPVSQYEGDVHSSAGFGCVACHGGDAEEFSMMAMDPARGYIGVPEPQDVESVCGRCHSDAEFMKRFDPAL